MADYTGSKKTTQGSYPVVVKETSGLFTRIETILTPEMLKSRYLKGVDVSDYTDEELKDQIGLATNDCELMSNLTFNPVQRIEVRPFDYSLYRNFIHFKMDHGPILSVEKLVIESSDENVIYELPSNWIDTRLAHMRQLNIIPLLTAFAANTANLAAVAPSGVFLFLQSLNNMRWMPEFWRITYTTGICKEDGKMPIIINDLIGLTTAIEILSAKQNQILYTSQSLGQDGISQASSGPGSQTYQPRINMLIQKRDSILAKIKSKFTQKYFINNI